MRAQDKIKARALRATGYSMKEISQKLVVAKSTVSFWVRDVPLSDKAQTRIEGRCTKGQLAAQKTHHARTRSKDEEARIAACAILKSFQATKETKQVLCAVLYWCEGAKLYNNRGQFAFANSDPALVASFLKLLRESFPIDERKFRVCVHLHGYHNERKQVQFWSKTTGIPIVQFMRSFRKSESGHTIREGYPGCVQVRYNDKMLLRRVLAIARGFLQQTGL